MTNQSRRLTRTVQALGWVSLLTDFASKMVYPLTPFFLTSMLGAPVWTVGLIEGIAESTASILKLYSGWLSDWAGRRKPFALAGYSLGALSKLGLALSGTWGHVLGARLFDRIGKGLRAAPRDVLIVENCTAAQRGQAFGLHHSLETVGEVLGPLVGFVFLQHSAGNYRGVFAIAFFPALLGVLILLTQVKEQRPHTRKARPQFTLQGLSPTYRQYLLAIILFSLGNSSDVFLLLRAQELSFTGSTLLLLYAAFNLVAVGLGLIAGRLSDQIGRRPLLVSGYLVFAITYLGFAQAETPAVIWLLFMLYGLYGTLTRGVQKAFVADLVHPNRRGAETGTFHMVVGLAALPASLIAGWLYAVVSTAAPFYVSSVAAVIATLLLMRMHLPSLESGS
ncbi:MFS transporter [Adonisia turfae]|uniref:MFS transporter n=1 Tax=Adonisia turfae CCMR0081 TaxID=2292702 RepID=A0A6M0RL34_9CYAN|nr:MFS transporter [Adonisia turfae]NEZ56915.1 MFS transporter [Adonisia turfae CCMR0081]